MAVDDAEEIARMVVTTLPTILRCRTIALALHQESTWRLMLQHAGQRWPDADLEECLTTVEHLFALTLRRGTSLLVPHQGGSADWPLSAWSEAFEIRCLAALPLHTLHQQVGMLLVGDPDLRRITWHEVLPLQRFAESLTTTLVNLRLRQQLESLLAARTTELRRVQDHYQAAAAEIATLKIRLQEEQEYFQDEIKTNHNFEEIIGQSRSLKTMLRHVEAVAQTDTTVLLLGETGTGKELVARALHHLSARRQQTLVKVNCTALPAGLIESELFGHEKGAFTGALSRKIGRFELANGGTIFLDEIGDLPLELQAKLLRVLQEMEFERLGSERTIRVDVRVIAATNRDLEYAVLTGTFRADLYYRLHVFPIRLPPLRERQQDIPLLVRYFMTKYGAKCGKKQLSVSQKTLDTLMAYPWPGNIRELENIVERAMILSTGAQLELGTWFPPPQSLAHGRPIPTLEELERDHIVAVLDLTNWRVSGEKGAARLLGMKPTTLEARMKKLGITRRDLPTYRDTPIILGRPTWSGHTLHTA
jgi:transcriptional regulator with GAF, ATPase, and Fis domain